MMTLVAINTMIHGLDLIDVIGVIAWSNDSRNGTRRNAASRMRDLVFIETIKLAKVTMTVGTVCLAWCRGRLRGVGVAFLITFLDAANGSTRHTLRASQRRPQGVQLH